MVGDQFAKAVILTEADIHEPLHQIHVGPAVALDDDRPVLSDRDVPTDQNAIGEG